MPIKVPLFLVREYFGQDGVCGSLFDADGIRVAFTLEHAYVKNGKPVAKVPSGSYKCVKGPHRLHNMSQDFETFEVMGVPNAKGILFHWGNYNKDSDGCILVGTSQAKAGNGDQMVTASRAKFAEMMDALHEHKEFILHVRSQI